MSENTNNEIIKDEKLFESLFVDIKPFFKIDLRYATENNFMKKKLYVKGGKKCFLRRETLEKLLYVKEDFEKIGLKLKIFDGYRPLFVQKMMWDFLKDERFISNPYVTFGKHTRGTAVDLTLIEGNNEDVELLMPSEFDEFSIRAHRNFMGYLSDSNNENGCKNGSENGVGRCDNNYKEAIKNRKLLEDVMQRHGFIGLPSEWWHFDLVNWRKFSPFDVEI